MISVQRLMAAVMAVVSPAVLAEPEAPEKAKAKESSNKEKDAKAEPAPVPAPVPKPVPAPKPAPQAAPAVKVAPMSPERAAMLRMMETRGGGGKSGSERTVAATRAPGIPAVNLVAIAPESVGVTHRAQPRIWWWQSETTRNGELEFVLTEMGKEGEEKVVLEAQISPRDKGFNMIDLSLKEFNVDQVKLKPGVEYQWSLNCNGSSIKMRMVLREDQTIAAGLAKGTPDDATIGALVKAGNWYELYDSVAYPSQLDATAVDYAAVRGQMLEKIGLGRKR